MCTNPAVSSPNFISQPITPTLTRPRSDPYIPVTLLASITDSRVQFGASKSFDDLTERSTPFLERQTTVRNCKNCSHAFRIRVCTSSTNSSCSSSPDRTFSSEEFCCKDCETCFTLFPSPANNRPLPGKLYMEDVRQSIYAFQQELLTAETERKIANNVETCRDPIENPSPPSVTPSVEPPKSEENLLRAAKKKFNVKYFQELKKQKQSCYQNNDPQAVHLVNGDFFSWMFQRPKPVRPQLHAFI